MRDYEDMECQECRTALSARLDDEADPREHADVDAHLAGCVQCSRWYDEAAAVTRLARTGPVTTRIDVTDAAAAAAPGRARARVTMLLRAILAVAGVAQLTLGVLQLVAAGSAEGHAHGGTIFGALDAGHVGHESAAWDIALGAGFLWIAARRSRPTGILPLLSVFVGALVALNISGLATGTIDLAHVAVHAFVAVGYLTILALSRPSLAVHRPPRDSVPARPAVAPTDEIIRPSSLPPPLHPRWSRGSPATESRRRAA